MRMSLNDLFVQILQSEQKAKERKALLYEVKNEIAKVKDHIKDVREERISTQGQLVVKTQHQTDAELSVVWLTHKEVILRDQLDQVARERDGSAQELNSVESAQHKQRETFVREIAGFNQTHDLCGAGKEQRETEARQQLRELRKQEESLLTDLSDYRQTKANTRKLQEVKQELESEVTRLEDTLQGLQKKLERKSAVTLQLERAKTGVASVPQTDAEFVRLRSKLEACHEEGLEAMCQTLQQEVDRLQRQRWQQQLQRQANQPGGSAAAAAAAAAATSAQQLHENAGPRKTQKKKVQPSPISVPNQSDPVNTWSSFHAARPPAQPTPPPQDACRRPPPTKPSGDHRPAATGAAAKPRAALSVKKEPPFRSGGVSQPNLAKLDTKTGTSLNPAANANRFRFRQKFPQDRAPSVIVSENQPTGPDSRPSASAPNQRVDSHGSGRSTQGLNPRPGSGSSQVPGTAKKVRFKY